jgi:hypothetical protein
MKFYKKKAPLQPEKREEENLNRKLLQFLITTKVKFKRTARSSFIILILKKNDYIRTN